jgi:hypothetical protein
VPRALATWMEPFQGGFTAPTWRRVLVLVTGAILVPGRRTIAAALRVMGLEQVAHFSNYHRVLNRNMWSGRWLSRRLLRQLVDTFVPGDEPVVIGLDDTIERRWGARIKARGIYRDPVRSSHGHFVKASGLRWLSLMLLPGHCHVNLARTAWEQSSRAVSIMLRSGCRFLRARHRRRRTGFRDRLGLRVDGRGGRSRSGRKAFRPRA